MTSYVFRLLQFAAKQAQETRYPLMSDNMAIGSAGEGRPFNIPEQGKPTGGSTQEAGTCRAGWRLRAFPHQFCEATCQPRPKHKYRAAAMWVVLRVGSTNLSHEPQPL